MTKKSSVRCLHTNQRKRKTIPSHPAKRANDSLCFSLLFFSFFSVSLSSLFIIIYWIIDYALLLSTSKFSNVFHSVFLFVVVVVIPCFWWFWCGVNMRTPIWTNKCIFKIYLYTWMRTRFLSRVLKCIHFFCGSWGYLIGNQMILNLANKWNIKQFNEISWLYESYGIAHGRCTILFCTFCQTQMKLKCINSALDGARIEVDKLLTHYNFPFDNFFFARQLKVKDGSKSLQVCNR